MSAGAAGVRQPRFAVVDGLDPGAVDAEYAADRWRSERLGFDALAGRDVLIFVRQKHRTNAAEGARRRLHDGSMTLTTSPP